MFTYHHAVRPRAGTPDMHDLPLHLWYSITRFGGAGLTLPLALTIALWLALGYTWRLAAGWLAIVATAISVVALTKIAFIGWGLGVREWDFTGVSGHAMLSTAVYPAGLFLTFLPMRTSLRVIGVTAGIVVGMAVGLSRVVLDAHSPSEAIAGCIIGALAAVAFVGWAWDAMPAKMSAVPIAVSLLMLTVALHDVRVPTQRWITHVALHLSGRDHPYVRARWKTGLDAPRPEPRVAPPSSVPIAQDLSA